jgi:hypothetical protein
MARTLAPHGTPAAYARHLRHGEPACADCLSAVREARSSSRNSSRSAQVAAFQSARSQEPVIVGPIDELAESLESRRLIKQAISECTPGEVVALSKEWERLASRIAELQKLRAPDLITALQERRAARIGRG